MADIKRNSQAPSIGAYFSAAVALSAAEIDLIRPLVAHLSGPDQEQFLAIIADIAAEYRGESAFQIRDSGKVTPGQYRAALKSLRKAGNGAADLVDKLDWLTLGRIEAQAFVKYKADGQLSSWARTFPEELQAIVSGLLDAEKAAGNPNRKKSTGPEVFAAWRLRRLFASVGLNFSAYDGGSDKLRQGGAAAQCLRIITNRRAFESAEQILGNVEHYLQDAMKLPL